MIGIHEQGSNKQGGGIARKSRSLASERTREADKSHDRPNDAPSKTTTESITKCLQYHVVLCC